MKYSRSLLAHPFFQGTLIFTVLSFTASIFSYIFNFLLAHTVTLSQYGEYSTAISYFSIFSVPFGALNLILIKKIGDVHFTERKAYISALEKHFYKSAHIYAIKLVALSIIIALVLYYVSHLKLSSVLFVLASTILTFFITMYASFFQAQKRFMFAGMFLCVFALFRLGAGGISAFIHTDLWELYLLIVIIHFAEVLFGKWYLNRGAQFSNPKISFPSYTSLVQRKSFYVPMITFLGLIAIVNIDLMIVKRFFEASEVGFYAAVSLLGRIILYISLPLTTVAFSFFTDQDTKHQTTSVLWTSFGLLSVLGVISVIGYSIFPNLVVQIIFGSKYLAISPVVWLAAVFGSLYSLTTLLGQYWVSQLHPISMASVLCSILQGILLLYLHDTFMVVLYVSIGCTSILLLTYLSAFIYRQRFVYG